MRFHRMASVTIGLVALALAVGYFYVNAFVMRAIVEIFQSEISYPPPMVRLIVLGAIGSHPYGAVALGLVAGGTLLFEEWLTMSYLERDENLRRGAALGLCKRLRSRDIDAYKRWRRFNRTALVFRIVTIVLMVVICVPASMSFMVAGFVALIPGVLLTQKGYRIFKRMELESEDEVAGALRRWYDKMTRAVYLAYGLDALILIVGIPIIWYVHS